MWAVLEGEIEVFDCLVEQGANVFIASTKPWDIPGHDWGFPRFSNALDILQIAMARSSYNEFHLPILLKLQPMFKVAEFRAVRDVPLVDPATPPSAASPGHPRPCTRCHSPPRRREAHPTSHGQTD